MPISIKRLAATLTVIAGAGLIAPAALAAPVRIRGEISDIAGKVLTIRTTAGTEAKVELADKTQVGTVVKATMSEIGPESYVGAAGMAQPDGSIRALEVHIFPPALRGAGEGYHDFDLEPGSTMTNAAVSGKVEKGDGTALTLTYPGGTKTFIVGPKTPIVKLTGGSMADVKPGVGIIIFAADKGADGMLTTNRITVGKDGVNPPM